MKDKPKGGMNQKTKSKGKSNAGSNKKMDKKMAKGYCTK